MVSKKYLHFPHCHIYKSITSYNNHDDDDDDDDDVFLNSFLVW